MNNYSNRPLKFHEVFAEESRYLYDDFSHGNNYDFNNSHIQNPEQIIRSIQFECLSEICNKILKVPSPEKLKASSCNIDPALSEKIMAPLDILKKLKESSGTIDPDMLSKNIIELFDSLLKLRISISEHVKKLGIGYLAISPSTENAGKDAKTPEDFAYANRLFLEELFPYSLKRIDDILLERVFRRSHEKDDKNASRALCLSGGGIRSATFALGIIQGLARYGLLGKINYLSTVSGGGYIGSWLSAWASRHSHGLSGVEMELRQLSAEEPFTLRHLRKYSNYLSPVCSWFSMDIWTLASTYLRNLLLTWLVLMPALVAVIMLPRISESLVQIPSDGYKNIIVLSIACLCMLVALTYIRLAVPSVDKFAKSFPASLKVRTVTGLFLYCSLPLLIASASFMLWWGWTSCRYDMLVFASAGALLSILSYASARTATWIYCKYFSNLYWKFWIGNIALSVISGALGGVFLYSVFANILPEPQSGNKIYSGVPAHPASAKEATHSSMLSSTRSNDISAGKSRDAKNELPQAANEKQSADTEALHDSGPFKPAEKKAVPEAFHREIYVCFAIPVFLLILWFTIAFSIPLISEYFQRKNIEWLGRLGGLLLIMAVIWAVSHALILFGSFLFVKAAEWVVVAGGFSGVLTLLLGWSSKTQGVLIKDSKASSWKDIVAKITAPVAIILLCITISVCVSWPIALFLGLEWGFWQSDIHILRETPWELILFLIPLLILISFIAGIKIKCTRFSLHEIYRDCLSRAYLGASRPNRDSNWFTRFDDNDDIPISQLRCGLLKNDDISDLQSLLDRIAKASDKVSPLLMRYLEKYDEELFGLIVIMKENMGDSIKYKIPYFQERMVNALNHFLCDVRIKQESDGQKSAFCLDESDSPICNDDFLKKRKILQEAYPSNIKALEDVSCFIHIVNTALNIVNGNNFAWDERKADSFTFSPLHCGNRRIGYRRSENYTLPDNYLPVSIGTALTISGAAASPNMGYHSSPAVTFLMALFNLRLGCWLRNPAKSGKTQIMTLRQLCNEAVGNTNENSSQVYLSDGGHFENLGLYEMVLRRCRFIIVSDAGCDPEYKFENLGNAVRKIRIDLGIPIEIPDLNTEHAGKMPCIACGTIRYGAVDADARDGYLIYIKAGPCLHEPLDVVNYKKEHGQFPHDTTLDQFFSESQFESYRALGENIINEICKGKNDKVFDWPDFRKLVQDYVSGISK